MRNILIIDNEERILEFTSKCIRREEFRVEIFSSVEALFVQLMDKLSRYDN